LSGLFSAAKTGKQSLFLHLGWLNGTLFRLPHSIDGSKLFHHHTTDKAVILQVPSLATTMTLFSTDSFWTSKALPPLPLAVTHLLLILAVSSFFRPAAQQNATFWNVKVYTLSCSRRNG
jgi:hypothetical protein